VPEVVVVYWPSVFDPLLSVSGFVVGLLVGLTGVGGGALMTPLLILFFGVRPTLAVGTDLAYATITKVVGSLQYIRMGHVNYPYVRWLLVGSIPGSLFAVFFVSPWFAHHQVDVESFTSHALGVMLVAVGVISVLEGRFFSGRLRDSWWIRNESVQNRYKEPILIVGGALIGLAVGMTSVGSGAMLMAILLLVSELPLIVLVGTDLVHATLLLGASGAAHFVKGNVEVHLVMALLIGSVPGIWLGSRLAPRVPATPLRYLLALILAATGFKLAFG
jgi:uncharacterized membrane protein YfcA